MKIKSILAAFFLSIASFCLNAQHSGAHSESKPHVDVTGTYEMEVVPDEIYVAIIVRERYEGRDKISIESQEEKLKAAIKELGIALENLSLSDANADYVKVKLAKKDVLTKKDYVLKLSDATQLGKVFEQLEKLQINDAYVSKLNHSKMDEFRKEVRKKAVVAAEDKARYMLIALGQQLGKPLIVEEIPISTTNYNYRASNTHYYSNVRFLDGDSDSDSKSDEISFKKITIKASVFARFEIKQ